MGFFGREGCGKNMTGFIFNSITNDISVSTQSLFLKSMAKLIEYGAAKKWSKDYVSIEQ